MLKRWLIAMSLGWAVVVVGSPASAQGTDGATAEEARESFKSLSKSAQEKYAAGDLEGAIADFEAAYAIKPVSNILYNVGRIHEKLGNIDEAIANYEKFVVAPNVEISARQDAVTRLRTLREVRELQREEEATQDGGEAGDANGGASESNVTESKVETAPPVDRTAAWVFLGIGATTLVGSGVFAILTSTQHTAYEDASTLQARRDAANLGKTFGYLSDGLLVTGVVTSLLGTIFWFTAEPDETDVTVAPVVGRDGAGVRMSWRF